jgi:hypothetical protein
MDSKLYNQSIAWNIEKSKYMFLKFINKEQYTKSLGNAIMGGLWGVWGGG